MSTQRPLVVFSDDWGRWPSSSQHLARALAVDRRILWVETLGMRLPRPALSDARRSLEKVRSWTGRGPRTPWAPLPDGVVRLAPPMHPWFGSRLGAAANDAIVVRAVRRRAEALGLRDPVLLMTVPLAAGVVGRLGESAAIYYRVDDFALWPGYAARAIRTREALMLARVDGLVVSADNLDVPDWPGPRLVLDHGVDLAHFVAGGPRPAALPPGPVLLFAGKIDERLDQGLLLDLPGRVVLVGRATVPVDPRLCHLPEVPYAELPAWLAAADVLLLPYLRNAQTDTITPLKLREYLASGTPVAATALPEVCRVAGEAVDFGDGRTRFAAAVRSALQRPATDVEGRRQLARDFDWPGRAARLLDFIDRVRANKERLG